MFGGGWARDEGGEVSHTLLRFLSWSWWERVASVMYRGQWGALLMVIALAVFLSEVQLFSLSKLGA